MHADPNTVAAQTANEASKIGDSEWVRQRLAALPPGDEWASHPAADELTHWLYAALQHRVHLLRGIGDAGDDIVQDAMVRVVRTLQKSRARIAQADNPAAMFERVADRAIGYGRHRTRMLGLAGVAANGRNWKVPYPRQIEGPAAARLFESFPAPAYEPCRAAEDVAARTVAWVSEHVGVQLSTDAIDATVYVLDRLVAGISRTALVRGGSSGLAVDPAMHHLGFDSPTSRAFSTWLLGRTDPGHGSPSVLDAAVDDDVPGAQVLARWRRKALTAGFARELPAASGPRVA